MKRILITDEVHKRLLSIKRKGETFSDVITRVLGVCGLFPYDEECGYEKGGTVITRVSRVRIYYSTISRDYAENGRKAC